MKLTHLLTAMLLSACVLPLVECQDANGQLFQRLRNRRCCPQPCCPPPCCFVPVPEPPCGTCKIRVEGMTYYVDNNNCIGDCYCPVPVATLGTASDPINCQLPSILLNEAKTRSAEVHHVFAFEYHDRRNLFKFKTFIELPDPTSDITFQIAAKKGNRVFARFNITYDADGDYDRPLRVTPTDASNKIKMLLRQGDSFNVTSSFNVIDNSQVKFGRFHVGVEVN